MSDSDIDRDEIDRIFTRKCDCECTCYCSCKCQCDLSEINSTCKGSCKCKCTCKCVCECTCSILDQLPKWARPIVDRIRTVQSDALNNQPASADEVDISAQFNLNVRELAGITERLILIIIRNNLNVTPLIKSQLLQ